jgi:hypothetical protein
MLEATSNVNVRSNVSKLKHKTETSAPIINPFKKIIKLSTIDKIKVNVHYV